jgi:predicted RNA-binding protein (virulence factor B family)
LYHDELPAPLNKGQKLKAYIKKIREDQKIDLSLYRPGYEQVDEISEKILERLKMEKGFLPFNDKSDSSEIFDFFGISKKLFKKSIGLLYKNRLLLIENNGIRLVDAKNKGVS